MNKKISIIIPVYNCEKYIKRCIDSILSQNYKDIEIIIVNDGSTDKTNEILESYKKMDNRIVVIEKENSGVSDSRNIGVMNAKGDYISFIDADDYIEPNIYMEVMKNIIKYNCDIEMFSYYEVVNDYKKKVYFPWNEVIKEFRDEEINNKLLPHMISKLKTESNSIMGAVWRAVIKSDIAKKNKFIKDIPISEDLLYLIDCISDASTIVMINKCLYNYIRHINSATTKYKYDFDETNEKVQKELIKRLNDIGMTEDIEKRLGLNRFRMYTLTFSNIMRNKESSFFEKYRLIKNKTKICNKDLYIKRKIVNEMNLERKFIYFLVKTKQCFFITCLFYFKSIIKKF